MQEDKKDKEQQTLDFGKHRGTTYEKILETNPKYCLIIFGMDYSPVVGHFQKWVSERLDKMTVPFGKYAGSMTMLELKNSKSNYCWFIKNLKEPRGSMVGAIKYLE